MSFPKIEGYVVTEKLGSGSYSTVYKAYTKVGARTTVAVKCIDKSRIKHSGTAIDNLVTEIRLLKTLTHPHIVHMKEFTWDDRNIYIIMEYCCGGDLSKYIRRYGRVPEKQVLYFLQQLASALKFLREKGVVHMDLKPHNLLLHKTSDGKYILKVADFGFAQYMTEQCARNVRGSPLYMAPEMLLGEHDARVDLWSVGVIMYECLFGRAPYSSATFNELLDKIQRKAPIEIPANASISEGCRDLMTRLLRHDPERRISYEEFFTHEYLDLEHMPNKENYNKAVSLIKQAIEMECSGRLADALIAYSESLRYLVPAVGAEGDPVRRSALAAKLRQYMDRAEEIKRIVKGQNNAAQVPNAADSVTRTEPAPVASGAAGCGERFPAQYAQPVATSGHNATQPVATSGHHATQPVATNGHNATQPVAMSGRHAMEPVATNGHNATQPVATNGHSDNGQNAATCHGTIELPAEVKTKPQDKRGALARLLRRPVPYLDRDTSEESTHTCQKHEEANDAGCKIT